MSNPFTPNFGQVPLYMAGRRKILSKMTDVFEGDMHSPNLCSLFTGARGTGKTALLRLLGQQAQSCGWLSVFTSSGSGLLEDVYEQTINNTTEFIEPGRKTRVKSVNIGKLIGVEFEKDTKRNLNWRSKMSNVLDKLTSQDIGLVIIVDEVDPKLNEVERLVATYQHFIGEGKKVSLLMAGLPNRISSLLNGKSISFLRRANIEKLGKIADADVKSTFKKTVEGAGKTINDEALSLAVSAIEGFPYMIQLVGFYAWSESGKSTIKKNEMTSGIALAQQAFQTRVLDATLNELTQREIEFLLEMTKDERFSKTTELSSRLNMASGNVSAYKKRLLERGVIEEPRRGCLVFSLPHLRNYLPKYAEFFK